MARLHSGSKRPESVIQPTLASILNPPGSGLDCRVHFRQPDADTERPHGLKYRLYYGKAGRRLVGYDNERGKGDHKHIEGEEFVYAFTTVERLIGDFLVDVARLRGEL